jgi:hypothetical protein
MIIIGSGSRDWIDYKPIQLVMIRLIDTYKYFIYYHGNQRGFDKISANHLLLLGHPADKIKAFPYIKELGKAGGMVRNKQMLDAALDIEPRDNILLIAMPLENSIGTYGMINICKKAKIQIQVFDPIVA